MSKTKKNLKNQHTATELLETPEAVIDKISQTEHFLRRNRMIVGIVAGVILLSVAAYLFYNYLKNQQNQEAQEQMFPAVYYLESDSLKKALKGDGNYPGLEDIAKDYPLSKAANLAHFYAGVAYLKEGEFQKAIDELKSFSSSDVLVQGRAYALTGDAYLELNKTDEAISYYKKAADYKPNKFFTPAYLMKLALAYELKKQNAEAIGVYDKIISQYFESAELVNAKKYKARLESLSQN